jgi:flagellar motor protein MotB
LRRFDEGFLSFAAPQKLSAERATMVRAYLEATLGTTKLTIIISGRSAADPIINNLALPARAVNRRVEIIVQ